MNLSKGEQRVLHALAQGGYIRHERPIHNRISRVECFTRDGYVLCDCTLTIFSRLRRKRFIESCDGHPYRISRKGRAAVRPQPDNR